MLPSYPPIMTRAILTLYDLLIPFDLRAQTFRVNMELPTYYHQHTRKKIIFEKMSESDLSAYKNFFENAHDSKWAILHWPWKFGSLGQMGSKMSYRASMALVIIGGYDGDFSVGKNYATLCTTYRKSVGKLPLIHSSCKSLLP